MELFQSGFIYILIAFIALCILFSQVSGKLKFVALMLIIFGIYAGQQKNEDYRNSDLGRENIRQGRNYSTCYWKFVQEIRSYGLYPEKYDHYDQSESADLIEVRANGGLGLPSYDYSCAFNDGSEQIKRFIIIPW